MKLKHFAPFCLAVISFLIHFKSHANEPFALNEYAIALMEKGSMRRLSNSFRKLTPCIPTTRP